MQWMGPACAAASFPAAGGASKVSPPSAQLSATLLSQCLVEVVNSLVGCRAEGSASAERLLADGGEGGRDCDLSEGGAVLRKGGADSSRSVYHGIDCHGIDCHTQVYTIDHRLQPIPWYRLQPKAGTTTLTYDSP